MAHNSYDPFFDNENDNETTKREQLESFKDNDTPNNNDNSINNNFFNDSNQPTPNNSGYNNNYQNNGGYPPQVPYVRQKRPASIGILLVIMIPLLIITNVVTSFFVFNFAWQDAQASMKADIGNLIDKNNSMPVDNQFLAYNISKQQLPSVLEITSVGSTGSSSGTGFIISDDGYFLTNAHVVTYQKSVFGGIGPNASIKTETSVSEKISVTFADNETAYSASVVAYDTNLDLAVCKFDSALTNLQPVTFADSTLLSYGEPCVAIGNAQGYGLATTEGVISAPIQYYKLSSRDEALTSAVQHSAAINPGNSGGPLFNIYGQVIGINSFKLTGNSDLAIDGMGFAIPSAVAKD